LEQSETDGSGLDVEVAGGSAVDTLIEAGEVGVEVGFGAGEGGGKLHDDSASSRTKEHDSELKKKFFTATCKLRINFHHLNTLKAWQISSE
jgi:hypothetical protein